MPNKIVPVALRKHLWRTVSMFKCHTRPISRSGSMGLNVIDVGL